MHILKIGTKARITGDSRIKFRHVLLFIKELLKRDERDMKF